MLLLFLSHVKATFKSRGSSVSMVSDYGLDDREIKVRSVAEAKEFFL
jgi:hypothetical protein